MAYTNCESTIEPGEVLCSNTHCNNYRQTSTMKRVCYCQTWDGKPIPGCEPKGDSFPVPTNECHNRETGTWLNISQDECEEKQSKDKNWHWDTCYCCCSCMAWNTEILISGDTAKYIQEFQLNDEIMVASYDKNSKRLEWTKSTVTFSNGVSAGGKNTMLSVIYNDQDAIIVTNDQLFLMPDGYLKRADRLVPGKDKLIDFYGKEVEIKGVIAGEYRGGIHHVSTPSDNKTDVNIDINNHLICANGIVCGDYYLQIMQNSDVMKKNFSKDHDDLPVLGSEKYINSNANIRTTAFQAILPNIKSSLVQRKNFIPRGDCTMYIPDGAQKYVTDEQADEIYNNAPKYESISKVNINEIKYLFKLFNGFYPDIRFALDIENEVPNMYAFKFYDQKFIVISGQLLRTKCLHQEGLAVVLSHGIGSFYGAPPANKAGYACAGQADFFGIGYVLQDVYFKEWKNVTDKGIAQIKELFSYIKDDPNKNSKDTCESPSVSCRIETLKAATSGMELPICAGGPAVGGLEVLSAVLVDDINIKSVAVTFNMPVSKFSAENIVNYCIEPLISIEASKIDSQEQSKVVLAVRLPEKPKGKYKIKVSDVYAFNGSTINQDKNTAEFEIS